MKNYKFTENWFDSEDLEKFLPLKTKKELHILEIGSFEGKSTIWFLDNLLQNPNSTITCVDPWTTYSQDSNSFNNYSKDNNEWDFTQHKNTFLYNINETGFKNKVIVTQGFSHEILPELIVKNKKFDIIFIDGNHVSPFVLTDSVMSWYLCNSNGIIIFDDYLWKRGFGETLTPKLAVDSFINNFKDYCEIIWDGYRKAIIKK